jgi:hypothetical protein
MHGWLLWVVIAILIVIVLFALGMLIVELIKEVRGT